MNEMKHPHTPTLPAAASKAIGPPCRAATTFCCIAIDHFKRTPEETAAKLLEVSSKARENGETYALDQAMSAAAKVALNPRSPAR